MRTRTITVIAASVGVAVATATGVTYASSALESTPKSTPKSAPVVVEKPAPAAGAPAAAPLGGTGAHEEHDERRREHDKNDNNDNNDHHHGRILINERPYAAVPGSCIAVVNVATSTVGATNFNIRNESEKTVEFFNGITCDNGPAVATVGPHSSTSTGPGQIAGDLIVGSFRVIHHDHHNNHHNKHHNDHR